MSGDPARARPPSAEMVMRLPGGLVTSSVATPRRPLRAAPDSACPVTASRATTVAPATGSFAPSVTRTVTGTSLAAIAGAHMASAMAVVAVRRTSARRMGEFMWAMPQGVKKPLL